MYENLWLSFTDLYRIFRLSFQFLRNISKYANFGTKFWFWAQITKRKEQQKLSYSIVSQAKENENLNFCFLFFGTSQVKKTDIAEIFKNILVEWIFRIISSSLSFLL